MGAWSLLVIDNQPLRKKAQRDYQKATRDLDNARAETERFHSQDKPLFTRWLHANFGPLITEMRELQVKLNKAQDLVNEVQQEYFFGGHASIAQAYKIVQHRRAHPDEEPESQSFTDADENEEFRREFEEAMREAEGDFQQHRNSRQSAPPSRQRGQLKQLYRKLARRLHPDNGRKLSPHEKELWHRTQTAYEAGHVDVLETILNLLDVDEKGTRNASVSTLLRLTADLKKSLRAIKRELTSLRRDVAWNFSRRDDHSQVASSTQATLLSDREKLLWLLNKYTEQIERWDSQSRVKGKRVHSRRANWMDEEWF
jgi:hypothetical protein